MSAPTINILVVSYSQSGQMDRVIEHLITPLREHAQVQLHWEKLQPETPYPYPWPLLGFLDRFPEAVYLDPPAMAPTHIPEREYDLIIVGYTVWYLAPASPITGFLKSDTGKRLLAGKPVATVTACRNMWYSAHENMRQLIAECGARHIDHAALIDQGSSLATFFTTPRWMFTGKKDRWLGVFPPAGVAEADIQASERFGHAICAAIGPEGLDTSLPLFRGLRAVTVDDSLISSEKIAKRSFLIWGKLIRKFGRQGDPRRRPILAVYFVFLILMIATVVPVSMSIRALLRPLSRQKTQRLKDYFAAPSGAGDERMGLFDQHD